MGFWDEVVKVTGSVAGAAEGSATPAGAAAPVAPAMSGALVQEAVGMLTQGGAGGLQDLVKQFEGQGLGHVIGSWLGSGENLPISGAQLQGVLGPQRLAEMAQRLGLPPEAAASTLAAVLPAVVDRLTPQGSAEPQLLRQGLEWLEGRSS